MSGWPGPPRPRTPWDGLLGAAWAVLALAIALHVAWSLLRPLLPVIGLGVGLGVIARWWAIRRWY